MSYRRPLIRRVRGRRVANKETWYHRTLIRRIRGRRARARTPAQFGFALRGWLRSEAPYEVLAYSIPGASGWTEGGCALLAASLMKWARGAGELVAIWGDYYGSDHAMQHLVWSYGDLYFDGEGASRLPVMVHRAQEWNIQNVEVVPYGKAAKHSMKLSATQCPARDVDALARVLQARFGDARNWGFAPRGRRAWADDPFPDGSITPWSLEEVTTMGLANPFDGPTLSPSFYLRVTAARPTETPDPRRVDQIARAMREGDFFASFRPVIVEDDDVVVDGHHRLAAARQLGIEWFPAQELNRGTS